MRSMRRGIKEMDLILTAYAESNLGKMSDSQLDLYDDLLNENDQDLYAWITGQQESPEKFREIISEIAVALQRN